MTESPTQSLRRNASRDPVDRFAPGSFGYIDAKIRALPSNKAQGDAFERLCISYLETAPEYRNVVRQVWLWNDWPGNWGIDKGCDLIAETNDGQLWGIQCKSDDPSRTLSKAALDSFLSETNRPEFAYRLLISTTNRIGRNLRNVLDGQQKPVGEVLRVDLESAEIMWPTTPSDSLAKVPKKAPLPHQREAIDDVVSNLRTFDRGQLIMACGTGKTLTSLWITEELRCANTLVLVPSLSLLDQFLGEWCANCAEPFDYIVVCSDLTVGERRGDHATVSTSELGIPPTTDVLEIQRALEKERERRLVVFCTYQSSDRVAAAQARKEFVFDLAIADEAHRCCTQSVDSLFATVLSDTKIKSKRRLFMTATPRYFSEGVQRKAEESDYEIASMDNVEQFGPEFHVLSFGKAIDNGLLADYRIQIVGVSDGEARKFIEERRLLRTTDAQELDARTLAAQIGLAKAMHKYDLRSLITFHSSITKASKFTDPSRTDSLSTTIQNMGEDSRPDGRIWSTHISYKMPTSKRRTLLRKLGSLPQDTRGVIGNYSCLGEGVDVPELDGIAFIDPKRSQLQIIQAVGRAIRKSEKNKTATIVIPVFIDESEDVDSVLTSSAFKPVWQAIRALRAHDTKLGETLDRARLGLPQYRTGSAEKLPDKIEVDIPALVDLPDFANAFYLRTVLSTTTATPLTIEMILEWADAHKERFDEYPKSTSGAVVDAPNESWAAISQALWKGSRGLSGGTTLAQLLAAERDVWNLKGSPPLSEDQILEWADAYKAEHGKYPTAKSGPIDNVPNETWFRVDGQLRQGLRGLKLGGSLARLLADKRGVRNSHGLEKLTIGQILLWADAHKEKHGDYPKKSSGPIEDVPDASWMAVDTALVRGNRGLTGGQTLAQLLAKKRGARNIRELPDLSETQILEWCDAFKNKHGKYPTKGSGPVDGVANQTWSGVDMALKSGGRGLPGGSSIAKLLVAQRGLRDRMNPPNLSEEQILEWAAGFWEKHGKYPNASSGSIDSAPEETWSAINSALKRGARGINRKSSLAKLLAAKEPEIK